MDLNNGACLLIKRNLNTAFVNSTSRKKDSILARKICKDMLEMKIISRKKDSSFGILARKICKDMLETRLGVGLTGDKNKSTPTLLYALNSQQAGGCSLACGLLNES